jgi:hypothetical protein
VAPKKRGRGRPRKNAGESIMAIDYHVLKPISSVLETAASEPQKQTDHEAQDQDKVDGLARTIGSIQAATREEDAAVVTRLSAALRMEQVSPEPFVPQNEEVDSEDDGADPLTEAEAPQAPVSIH